MKNFTNAWDNIEIWVAGACGLSASLVGIYGLITRYFFLDPIGWGDEVIIYLITWGLFIAGSTGVKDNTHVTFDVVTSAVGPKTRRVFDYISAFLSLAFSIFMVWYGTRLVFVFIQTETVSQSALAFPMWIAFLSVPVGFFLMSARFIQKIYGLVKNDDCPDQKEA